MSSFVEHKINTIESMLAVKKGWVRSAEGVTDVTLPRCIDDDSLINLKLYGNSVQDGTPTPDNPVEIRSVGELVTDEEDENFGKYKITIKASDNKGNIKFFNIFANEPIRKLSNYRESDEIDFKNKVIRRKIGSKIINGDESWIIQSTNDYGIINFYCNSFYDGVKYNGGILCDCFPTQTSRIANTQTEGIYCGESQTWIYIRCSNERCSTVKNFKSFLSDIKPQVLFIQKNETEERVEIPKLPTFRGTTIYEIATDVPVSEIEAEYYSVVKGD